MFLFRTEISPTLGSHRLYRCLILGLSLKQYGPVQFLINGDKTGKKLLIEKGFTLIPSIKEKLIKDSGCRCIIFDINRSSPDDIRLLNWAKSEGITTLQVGNLGSVWMDVEYIIDSSLDSDKKSTTGKIRSNGPEFSLLHHKFRHFFKVKRKYKKNIRHVLVSLGGAPQYRLLRKVIDELSRQQFQIKVAPGFYLKKSQRKVLKRLHPKLRFVGKTESLARSFFEADVACITAGQTVLEAAATGTPALYLYKDDMQRLHARQAENLGLGVVTGKLCSADIPYITGKINALTLDARQAMGMQGKSLVDGKGIYRFVDFFRNIGIIN